MNSAESRVSALAAKVGAVFPPEVEERAKAELADALNATRTKRERDDKGVIHWVEVPDRPMRVAVAVKILEFNVGKPVNRTITADVSPGSNQSGAMTAEDLLQLLCAAPETAAEILAKLKSAAQKVQKRVGLEIAVDSPLPEGGSATP